MLTIERDSQPGRVGYRIYSKPHNLDIRIPSADDIPQVVRHYYNECECAPDCPVCVQITARLPKADKLALHRPSA